VTKIDIVCSQCGSDSVVKDAFARWDVEEQDWYLSSVYDFTVCDDCGAEDCAKKVPYND